MTKFRSRVLVLAIATLLVQPPAAHAEDFAACAVAGIVKACPAGAKLKSGQVLNAAAVPWASAPNGTIPNAALVTAPAPASRQVLAGAGLAGGGTLTTDVTLSLPSVGTGSIYAYPSSITTDAQGRVSAATAGSAPAALSSTTPANVGTAAVGVGTTSARADHVHALPSTGTAGTYASPSSVTTDAEGRVTAVTAGSAPAAATRLISTGTGLQGGGDLSADRTISIDATVATLTGSQILTNKTLTAPAISSPVMTGTSTGAGLIARANGGTGQDNSSVAVNLVWASPGSGSSPGAAAYRSMVASDLPVTAVSAGSYPTSGQVPTFTAAANGTLVAAGSTNVLTAPAISAPTLSGTATGTYTLAGTPTITAPAISAPVLSGSATGTYTLAGTPTITSPAISGPTFSGTEGGTRTIGGTPTLGVNLAFGGFKGTGLGAPTAASSDAATATYAEAQKTGSLVVVATASPIGGASYISANEYLGPAGDVDSSHPTVTNVVPLVIPVPGTLKFCSMWGKTAAAATTNSTIYKATGGTNSPSYAATSIVLTMAMGTNYASDLTVGHAVAVAALDQFIVRVDQAWTNPGWQITCQFIPS